MRQLCRPFMNIKVRLFICTGILLQTFCVILPAIDITKCLSCIFPVVNHARHNYNYILINIFLA